MHQQGIMPMPSRMSELVCAATAVVFAMIYAGFYGVTIGAMSFWIVVVIGLGLVIYDAMRTLFMSKS
jgi:hypothetical protein